MSLEGSLSDFSIVEVVQLFAIGKKTGCVNFSDENFSGKIYFDSGFVYYAESVNECGSLSERLVRERKITQKAIRQAAGLAKITKDGSKSIVDVLVSGNYISSSELELSLKSLIVDAIFDVGLHRDAVFNFKQDEAVEDEFAIVKLSFEEIQAEIVRREKTWEAILKKIPDMQSKFVMEPGAADKAAEIRLKPVEWKILCLLDGERTLLDISKELAMSVYKVGKFVYGLQAAGLIKPSDMSDYVAEEYFAEDVGG